MHLSSDEVKKLAKRSRKDQLENNFLATWVALYPQLPLPERQYKFLPDRKFLWDFAWPDDDVRLAVEIQGGSFMAKSGHTSLSGQSRDCEKQRLAVAAGWRVLPFNSLDMKDVIACVEFTAQVLCSAKDIP